MVEDRILISGSTLALREILERNKAPELSAHMRAGMKVVQLSDGFCFVADFAGLLKSERKGGVRDMLRSPMLPGMDEAVQQVQAVAVTVTEAGQVQFTAKAICKDAAGATNVRKVADAGVKLLMDTLNDPDKLLDGAPENARAEMKELLKSFRANLGELKTQATDNVATATVAREPAAIAQLIQMLIRTAARGSEESK